MIEGYIGRPGAGKTYSLTRRLLRIADQGRPVYANYHIAHENVTFFDPLQLMDLPPGVIALDEAHLYFPARGALKLPMSWLTLMSQTRKRGWDIFYTTQHENRLDRVVRDITNVMWLSRAYSFGPEPWLFSAHGYEPEYFRKPKRVVARWFGRFDPKVAAAYDTYESVTEAAHLKSGDDVYRAQSAQKVGSDVQVVDDSGSGSAGGVDVARDGGGFGDWSGVSGGSGGSGGGGVRSGVLAWPKVLTGEG